MKILKLQIEGFTCYRKSVEIDFSDLELFAITGATGSGKSSIVDAIIFALYGKIPRVANDTASLISQGMERMSVLLEFAVGDQPYKVARRIHVKKSSQAILDKEVGCEWEGVASGVRQVNIEIIKILGLDYESFIRCIILPQGAFEKFLQDAKSRQEILTQLLNMEVLKKMQQSASKNHDDLKQNIQRIELRLQEEFSDATPEHLHNLIEENELLDRQLQEAREKLKSLQKEFEEGREVHELRQKLRQIDEQYQKYRPQIHHAQELKKQLTQAKAILPLLPRIEQLEAARQRYRKVKEGIRQQNTQISNKASELKQTQNNLHKAEEQLEQLPELEQKLNELQNVVHLSRQLEKQRREYQEEEQLFEDEQRRFQNTRRQYEDLQNKLGGLLREHEELVKQCKSLESKRNSLQSFWNAQEFIGILKESRETYNKCEQTRQKIMEDLKHKEKQLGQISKQYQQSQAQIEKLQEDLETCGNKEQLQELLQKLEQAQHLQEKLQYQQQQKQQEAQKLSEEQAQYKTLQDKQISLRQELERSKEQRQITSDSLLANQERYQALVPITEQYAQYQQQLSQQEESLANLKAQEKEHSQQKKSLEQQIKSLNKDKKDQEKLLEEAETQWKQEYTQNLAHSIRDHLKPGESCPVCDQEIEKLPKKRQKREDNLEKWEKQKQQSQEQIVQIEKSLAEQQTTLQGVEKSYKEAKEQTKQISAEKKKITGEMRKLEKELTKYLENLENIPETLQNLRELIQEQEASQQKLENIIVKKEGDIRELDARLSSIESRMQERHEKITECDGLITELQEKLKELIGEETPKSKQEIVELLEKIKALETQIQDLEKQLMEIKLQKQVLETQCQEAEKNLDEVQEECTQTHETWAQNQEKVRVHLKIRAENIEEALQQGVSEYQQSESLLNQAKNKKEGLDKTKNDYQLQQTRNDTTLRELKQTLKNREQKLNKMVSENESLVEKISEITQGENPEVVVSRIKQRKNEIEANHRNLRETYLLLEQSLEKFREDLQKMEEDSVEIQQEGDLLRKNLEKDATDLGFASFDQVFEQRVARETMEEWEQQIQQVEEETSELQASLNLYKDRLQGREVDEEKMNFLKQRIDEITSDVEEKTTSKGAISVKISHLEKHIDQVKKLTDELIADKSQEGILRQLAADLRANRFQTYVLEHALRTLAEDGSIQLDLLSSGRYEFTIDKRDFCIIDHWNGDEVRSIKTLSGGETFIASLSLALALAERIYQLGHRMGANCALESLFLDEGFGTLDEDHLDIVVKALNNLQGTGRTIGIISHLPILNNYLPARLVVQKHPDGSGVVKEGN